MRHYRRVTDRKYASMPALFYISLTYEWSAALLYTGTSFTKSSAYCVYLLSSGFSTYPIMNAIVTFAKRETLDVFVEYNCVFRRYHLLLACVHRNYDFVRGLLALDIRMDPTETIEMIYQNIMTCNFKLALALVWYAPEGTFALFFKRHLKKPSFSLGTFVVLFGCALQVWSLLGWYTQGRFWFNEINK